VSKRLTIACAGPTALAVLLVLALVPDSPLRRNDGQAANASLKKASFDSEAPTKAPAHWLPPEDWVYNHWLPYDEGRLYALIGVTRGEIWRQLRDDRHNLAQLAAKNGWPDPRKLASALVAPRGEDLTLTQGGELRQRALRTLTQGHLSQHLLFHSLHQFAIPSEAPAIFGVTDATFRALRRAEQSPLEIGRLRGRSPSRIQALATGVLRERVRFGTDTGAMSARQGRVLLRRQISQLPRWLAQVRYNGPPPTHAGRLTGKPRDFAANPALSADGARVVFESYLQKLPLALKRGEISVLSRAVGGPARTASFNARRRTPRSAYNPTVSADGRVVAFESAEGNLNFAKRYGQIRVFVNDAATGRTRAMPLPPARAGVSRSEYNPVISSDGRSVAYQAQRRGGQSAVYVTDLRTGTRRLASRGARSAPRADDGVYDPAISGDGRRVAFTTAASNLGAGDLRGRTQVFVRDLRERTTTLVSRATGAGGAIADAYSADPAISRDGRYVAFSSSAGNLAGRHRGGTRVYVRDLKTRRTTAVSDPRGFALKPSISADGSVVAYTSIRGGRSLVYYRDARGRRPQRLASRVSGVRGAPANGSSADAAISADGARVAFTSAAANLSADKADDRRGVFVRDLRSHVTTLASPAVPKAAVAAAVRPKVGPRAAPTLADDDGAAAATKPTRSSLVSIFDNAFHRGEDRPKIRLRAGGTLTWRWLAQQSHQVSLRSGPTPLRSPTKTAGTYSVRLDKPGRYMFVCSIHAPGMRMSAIVD